jgi:hypothetical protein
MQFNGLTSNLDFNNVELCKLYNKVSKYIMEVVVAGQFKIIKKIGSGAFG